MKTKVIGHISLILAYTSVFILIYILVSILSLVVAKAEDNLFENGDIKNISNIYKNKTIDKNMSHRFNTLNINLFKRIFGVNNENKN